jgi:hypothetical protein
MLSDLKARLGKDHPVLSKITLAELRLSKDVRYSLRNFGDLFFMIRNEPRRLKKEYTSNKQKELDQHQSL